MEPSTSARESQARVRVGALADRAGALTAAAYVLLGSILVWTRLTALGQSYWHDEVLTVTRYVRGGPSEILAGSYIPNNHQLYSFAGWVATSVLGESEVVLRLLSSIPFLLGVLLVTAWLHVRVAPLTAVLYLFFTTTSPMLFDLSRSARGYGIAFLAMSVLTIAALEAERTRDTRVLVGFFCAGLVGTMTLPVFGLAFLGTAAALLIPNVLRRRVGIGIALSIPVIALWYGPHLDDILRSSGQRDGSPIPWLGLPISPIDEVLIPGLLWFDDTPLTNYPGRLLVITGLAVLLLSSPLLRDRRTPIILGSGLGVTLAGLWLTQLWLQPRFVSYLLVPLLILLASGTSHALRQPITRIRPFIAVTTLAVVVAASVGTAVHLMRLPFEAWKDTASYIETHVAPGTPVLAYVSHEEGLAYYLSAPVTKLSSQGVVERVCEGGEPVVYVMQPYDIAPVRVPCLERDGTRYVRFRQHSRGGEINVWVVPERG